jgi:hypothetical protein
MALEIPGWLPLGVAAERLGVEYEFLRGLVTDGVFTRGRFTSEKRTAPIYLRVQELDAWRAEGVAGVRRVQATFAPIAEQAHDTGNPVA